MATIKIIRSVPEYMEAVKTRPFLFDLASSTVQPWYLGQADAGLELLPSLYRSGINPELEREMLRDFRMLSAEFIPPRSVTDWEWLFNAHTNGMPSRIIEWMANPLAALFHAVESLSTASHGKVWVFNPWLFNEMTGSVAYVPMVDSEPAKSYVVNLTDPSAYTTPRAEWPMAFRPYRMSRQYNTQGVYFTIHGYKREPIENYRPLLRKKGDFITFMLIDADRKKHILKELFEMNVTRMALIPTLTSLARTLTYRYSKDYVQTNI
jgi:hypothetical protein